MLHLIAEPPVSSTQFFGGSLLDHSEANAYRANFNRASFQFAHSLANHELFELPRLLELTRLMKSGDMYFNAGDVKEGQRWDAIAPTDLTIDEIIDRIETAGAWLLIKRAHRDPRYEKLLDEGLAEVQRFVGDKFPTRIKKSDALIFITSPNRVTPYHIDRECNFLMQIRGEKTICLQDRYDREVLPEREIENFWTIDNMNSAVFKEEYRSRATKYQLRPGTGVHIPVNAPHWVKNDGNISVTLALTFQFPDTALGNVYRWNHYLRKAGFTPTPPGRSKIRDFAKSWSMEAAMTTRRLLKRLRGKEQPR